GVHLRETLAALQPGLAFAVEDRDRLHVWVGVERGPVSWLRGLHADTDWRRTGAVANEGRICRGTLHGLRRDLGMTDGGHHPLPSARSVISRLAAIRRMPRSFVSWHIARGRCKRGRRRLHVPRGQDGRRPALHGVEGAR